jgi:integrase
MAKRSLPRWLHLKHGRYYLVRENRWHPLSRDLQEALIEYARLTAGGNNGEFGELIDRALADMQITIAASTFKNYSSCARRVLEAFAEFRPAQVRPHHIARFLDNNKDTPAMANLMRSFLKGVFARAVRWGTPGVEANPVRDIEKFRERGRDRYVTAEEFGAIREQASPTMQCLMDLAYITGQRIGDILKIRYADISEEGVFVKQQKTKNRVFIEMTPDLDAAIKQARSIHQSVKGLTLFHRRDGTPIPYNTVWGHWDRARKKAKITDVHFHDIRAASATDAKKQGLDSKTLLGHTTESSHKRYLRGKETPTAKPVKARKS